MSEVGERRPVRLRDRLRVLYNGRSRPAVHFRYALLTLDVLLIAYFVASTFAGPRPWFLIVDVLIAVALVIDFLARMIVAPSVRRYFRDPITFTDLVVIGTLLVPLLGRDFAFLRVLRALRAFRSFRIQRELRKDFRTFRRNEELIEALVNLMLFIFVVTAMVYVLQHEQNRDIENYVDALYFTVATLTTTGFGDITMHGTGGRLLAIVIMVVGVSLFLRLVRVVFRPQKVFFRCPACGLARHESDAVHCKACGKLLSIPNEDG